MRPIEITILSIQTDGSVSSGSMGMIFFELNGGNEDLRLYVHVLCPLLTRNM